MRRLLAAADVVIESSRPAALTHRGLGPTTVARRDGRVWLRITGHGADGERANWVAFGDDAAVSGGLVGGTDGDPVFCGDAIADPLTGLHAALAVAESLSRGGGELIELSMAAVAATYAAAMTAPPKHAAPQRRTPSRAGLRTRCGQRGRRAAAGRKAVGVMLIQRAALLDGTAIDIRVDEQIADVGDLDAAQGRGGVRRRGRRRSSRACTITMSTCGRPPPR